MPFVKTNKEGFYRDTETNIIVNKDYDKLDMYLSQREQRKKMAKMIQEHEQLKNDITEIKNLLQMLATKEK